MKNQYKNIILAMILVIVLLMNISIGFMGELNPVEIPLENQNIPVDNNLINENTTPQLNELKPKEIIKQPTKEELEKQKQKIQKEIKTKKFKENINKKILEVSNRTKVKDYGIYIEDLKDGYIYEVNGTKTRYNSENKRKEAYFYGASVIKLFQSYAIMKMITDKELDVKKTYKDPITGEKINILKSIEKMMTVSSNDAYCSLLRIIGPEKINKKLKQNKINTSELYAEIGPAKSCSIEINKKRYNYNSEGGQLTPNETGQILKELYLNKNNYYLGLLKGYMLNCKTGVNRISRGIEREYPLAHKTGTSPVWGAYNDAGIVYMDENPYIIVIYNQHTTIENGEKFVREVTKEVNSIIKNKDKLLK